MKALQQKLDRANKIAFVSLMVFIASMAILVTSMYLAHSVDIKLAAAAFCDIAGVVSCAALSYYRKASNALQRRVFICYGE